MFGNLSFGSQLFILDKNDTPKLVIASVKEVTNPVQKYRTTYVPNQPVVDLVMDIVAVGDGITYQFKQIPASKSIYEENSLFIADTREAMQKELENSLATSTSYLNNVDYHKKAVKAYKDMMPVINPDLAKEKEQEKRIKTVEDKLDFILAEIKSLINKEDSNNDGGTDRKETE